MEKELTSATGPHKLSPQTHLHLCHTRPLQQRLSEVKKMFDKHPVLSQKKERIQALAADRPVENKEHIAQLAYLLLNHEKSLWKSVKLDANAISPHNAMMRELDDAEKKHVESFAPVVNQLVRFDNLCEYALISDTSKYAQAHQDYQRFMAVAGVAQHLIAMQDLLEQQHLMLRKLDARLNIDAHRVGPIIEDLKLSLDDQIALAARLPEFSFK